MHPDSDVTGSSLLERLGIACLALPVLLAASGGTTAWQMPPGKDFPLVGGNWGNQRYSTLDRISRSNVRTLGGAWMLHLEDGKTAGNMQATPIVVGGVMFIASGPGNVFAIDARTGAVKWRYRSESTTRVMTNRGVVVAEGKVFAGQRQFARRARPTHRNDRLENATGLSGIRHGADRLP